MHILRIHCVDQPGIVAAVATSLSNCGCNIEESAQFHDDLSGQFFMRVVFSALTPEDGACFPERFAEIGERFNMHWRVCDGAAPVPTLLMVSKDDHCLQDLLYRWQSGALDLDIKAIVANHEDHAGSASHHNIPFHHLPITKDNKADQEQALRGIIEETGTELIVLARYMQILSNDFCTDFEGRIINIHHSFLPGFKGAKPYHQAHARGVKMIGATAHFANADLDEGPIITQDALPIDHRQTPLQLQAIGRDVETRTLARAVKLYTERRIFAYDGRTVIL